MRAATVSAWRDELALEETSSPKYQTVRRLMVQALLDRVWEPGERLPTEMELADALKISPGTVQKTYQMLVNEGLVVRQRGSGTFVSDGLQQMPDPLHCRFLADDGESYLPVYPKIIGRLPTARSQEAQRYFGPDVELGRLDRKIRAGDEFVVLSRFYASTEAIGPLLKIPDELLDGVNLKVLMLRSIERPITRISHFVTQAQAEDSVAQAIGVEFGAYITKVEALARTIEDAPLYFQELYIPPTRRRLVIESTYRP